MSDAISLLIGTRRGLFIARSSLERREWRFSEPLLAGREVYHASRDPRTGTFWAATAHRVWGPHLHRSTDGARTWETIASAPAFADGRSLVAVWQVAAGPANRPDTLFAGTEPAALFRTDDAGRSWQPVDTLNRHPTSATWQPAGGALALHSVQIDPSAPRRIYAAVSAGGAYRSDDDGATWQPINAGIRADFLPQRMPEAGQCVHRMLLHPARPERLYQQNHCGVYRSDDRGETWTEITEGLPSGFGYALALDAKDPDGAFVIPEASSHMRTTIEGRLRVYRSRDAGASWEALTHGLPQEHAWISVLRDGLTSDGLDPLGLYLGTSGGHVFASRDGGETWEMIAGFLPRVLCVSAAVRG